ncbi:MAG TPA: MFS transporter [Actinomycetota bacterium]
MDEVRTPPPDPASGGGDGRRRIPSLLAGYWAFGQFWGAWVIVVADVNAAHGLSYGEIGGLLTLLSIVAVAVMALVVPRLARHPLGTVVPASLAVLGAAALALALLPTAALWIGFVVAGAGNGLIDVFMNVDAQRTEVATRRPVLQWMHASYAAGGVTGAAIGGLSVSAGGFRVALGGVAVALAATAAWNAARGSRVARPEAEPTPRFSLSAFRRHPGLWVAGVVVLFAFLVEGSMDAWSGLYLQEELDASAAQAALAFAAFSGSLFLGRLFAGRVLFGLGARTTILVSGVGAAAGGAVAAAADGPLVVGAAFLVVGFAISAAAPAGFGLIESTAPSDQTNAIAAVTTVGYSGFVWSPPIFGWLAEAFSLRAAMAVIVSSTIGIVVGGLFATGSRTRRGQDARAGAGG